MSRNKIARLALLAILHISLPVLANDTLPEKNILIDRANYWDKLGRSDRAVQAWQQLLLVEPDNAQALAGLARHQAQSAGNVDQAELTDPESRPSAAPAEPDASVVMPAATQAEEKSRKVEDWADLYPGGLKDNAQVNGAGAGTEQGSDISSGQTVVDHTMDIQTELTVESGNQSPLPEAKEADAKENNHAVASPAAILMVMPEVGLAEPLQVELNPNYPLGNSSPIPSPTPPLKGGEYGDLIRSFPTQSSPTPPLKGGEYATVPAFSPPLQGEGWGGDGLNSANEQSGLKASALPDGTDDKSATQKLSARAHYWQKLGRSDRAAQAWQELLLVEPDNAEAQAGLARYQTQLEANGEQEKLPNPEAANLEGSKVERDSLASAEAVVATASESAQRAPLAVPVQPEGDGKKVENWADLYQSGLKENVLTDEPNASAALQADEKSSTPVVSAIAMQNDLAAQAANQSMSVEPKAAGTTLNAMAVPDSPVSRNVETARAPVVTIRAEPESGQAEKWPQFYQRGFKPALPEPDVDTTPGGSLLVSDKPSRQELLDQAKYWDSRGRADLSAKIRKELAPQAVAVASNKPVVMNPAMADKPKSTVSSKPEIHAASVATERVVAIKAAEDTQSPGSQTQVTLEENVQALIAQPSRQELLDRAQYWEDRGRSDLAAKVPDQLVLAVTKQGDAVLSKNPTASKRIALAERVIARNDSAVHAQTEPGMSEKSTALLGAAPGKQELEEQAAYWEARGRSDLASKARPAPAGAVAGSGRDAAVRIAAADRQVSRSMLLVSDDRVRSDSGISENARTLGNVTLTREELDEQAQYWEARGRSDLAEQLRKKLYALEPARPMSVSRQTTPARNLHVTQVRESEGASRSALEDSLLKNPGSMAARLDLAKIYQDAGEMAKARLQIDSVLAANPDLPDALYASAQLYATQRLWWETLHTLDKISPVSRTTEMGKLQKMAWAHVQIDRADALVRQGNNAEAELLLRQVAAELAVNYNQTRQPEPPPLWKSTTPKLKKARR
ncbi:MAG: tetratricopeptide repeat protein [Gallionella sp.]|nr:tetratricopeptide repeat protein [Gallionella sp.]